MTLQARSVFHGRERWLAVAVAVYVAALPLAHWQVPAAHVWTVAAVFSVLMNVTYVVEAAGSGTRLHLEGAVAAVLVVASVLGPVASPGFVIAAILAHGAWDLAKHFGAGVAFLRWYTLGCGLVDALYGGVLLVYWTA